MYNFSCTLCNHMMCRQPVCLCRRVSSTFSPRISLLICRQEFMGSNPSQSKTSGFQDKCKCVTVQERIGAGQVLYYSHMHSHIFVSQPDKASPLSCSMRWSLFPMKAAILSCPWSPQITGHDWCYQLQPFTQSAKSRSCRAALHTSRGRPVGLAFKTVMLAIMV